MAKFYYNGKLVRTSKNHMYTHAVINIDKGTLIGCRACEKGAIDLKESYLSERRTGMRNAEAAIEAFKKGKTYYMAKVGRRDYPEKFHKEDTLESLQSWLNQCKESIEYIQKNWKVVELEVEGRA